MWRYRVSKISRAEEKLLAKLHKESMGSGLRFQHTIILKATTPDFAWPEKRIAVYLDGPVHESSHVREKDEVIDAELEKRGWTVLRISYKAPLSERETQRILSIIKETVEKE
jgi:very-short-patch-repair endonuclease